MKAFLKMVALFYLSITCIKTYGQKNGQQYIDSLLQELPKQREDSNKVILLSSLALGYHNLKPDDGIKYGMQSLNLAIKLDMHYKLGAINNNLGKNYQNQGNHHLALECFFKALPLLEEAKDKQGIAATYGNIGNSYYYQRDIPNALNYYFKARKTFEEIHDKRGEAGVLSGIANIYTMQQDSAQALLYYTKALSIYEKLNNKEGIAHILGSIGGVYLNQQDLSKALEYYNRGLVIEREIGNKYFMAHLLSQIGNAYGKLNNYPKAIKSLEEALTIAEEIGIKSLIIGPLRYLGLAYIGLVADTKPEIPGSFEEALKHPAPLNKRPQVLKAINYLNRALAIGLEINEPGSIQDCYYSLELAYKLSGDYQRAVEAADAYHVIKDSIFSGDNIKTITKLEEQAKYEKIQVADSVKNAEAKKIAVLKLQRQKNFTYMGIAGILGLAVFSFFIFKERKKSEHLLLNILPSEVAQELKVKGYSDAKDFEQATVLFTDFKGFTQMSERMSAKELVSELNICFKGFDQIIHKYGIEKIKTIGDSYMAVGGLPDPKSSSPEKVVQAALEMSNFILKRKAEREKEGKLSFEMRVGIHTGPVVAGIVGIKKFQYDIWGDTVNTASRMESSGEVGRVNISGTTYELVKDKFKCEYRGKVSAKGKGEVDMYFVS